MSLDRLIDTLENGTMEIPEVETCSVDRIIRILAAFEVRYEMSSRKFIKHYQQLVSDTASASERFDYNEWYMMYMALTEQALNIKRSIRKKRYRTIQESDFERPAHAGLCNT